MAKKHKIPQNLMQMDIISALRGEDIPIEEPKEEIDTNKKEYKPWDFCKDIRILKQGNMLEDDKYLSLWSNYLVLDFLSAKTNDTLILNFFNQYQSTLSKEQMYICLLHFIPKDRAFYQKKKNVKQEFPDELLFVSKYFECSENEANEYINIMGIEWAKKIKEKFGDLI